MRNNDYIGLNALDIISIMSYVVQMQNLQDDKKYKNSVQDFEAVIQKEIDKLHKENDLIVNKLDDIQNELNYMKYRKE